MLATVFWPSHGLVVWRELTAAEWTPASVYLSGDLLVVPTHDNPSSFRLNGIALSPMPQKSLWIGVVPTGQTQFELFRESAQQAESAPWAPWRHPEIQFERHLGQVTGPLNPSEAVPLRLPAAVWQAVSEDSSSAQRLSERNLITELLSNHHGTPGIKCWQVPLDSRITSNYASPRTLPNGHKYFHTGEDRRAAVGTPLKAAGPGRVVFAGPMIVPGNNIIIDHGGGLFSRFLHLQNMSVKAGDLVTAGQLLGHTGATGRVEAPHLHWEIVWKGIHADPTRFLTAWARLCDP